MISSLEYQEKFLIEFIKLYESKPALWECGSEEYKDRKEKKRAYQALVAKVREIEPTATVDTVRKKINSLRACYRRVKRKTLDAQRMGVKHKNQWVYFKYLQFLDAETDAVEDEGGWSNCGDSKEDNNDESDAEMDIAATAPITSQSYGPPATSHMGLHDELVDNEIEGIRYLFSTSAQHQFLIDFIKLYEAHPALWKCGSEEYKNRKEKRRAYQALVAKFRHIEPTATVDTVKKKINSLRSCYRRVKNKRLDAQRMGEEYKNRWVYYKYFQFLDAETDELEEDEGGWSNCGDNKEDKNEETEVQKYDDKSNAEVDISEQHKFWIAFIKLYEARPELWNCHYEGFKDRNLKELAYSDLVQKMQEVEPYADVDIVKRKINSFRAAYRRTLNKARRAISQGQEPDYSWVYFKHFAFLHIDKNPLEVEDISQEKTNFVYLDDNSDYDDVEKLDDEENITTMQQDLSSKDSSKHTYAYASSPSPAPSPKRVCSVSGLLKKQKKMTKKTPQNDEADIFGIGWAYQYRNLSESQKLFAKKAIDDILFEARLGTLHRHSVQINK